MIIWVERHVVLMILSCDDTWVTIRGEVQENIGRHNKEDGKYFCPKAEPWPSRRYVEILGY
jgi:hypothetical protein